MATPSLWEILSYGPRAWGKAREREEAESAKALIPDLLELREVTSKKTEPYVDPSGYNVNLPKVKFNDSKQFELSQAFKTAGMDEAKFDKTRKENALYQNINELDSTPQRVDALNNKDIAPVSMSGGTAFNKYNTSSPIIESSDAVTQLANYRQQQAEGLSLRNSALQDVLEDPDIDPLTQATIANKKNTFQPQRVKVRRGDGKEVYMDATPLLEGGYSYAPATDENQQPLMVPASSAGPIEKDANLFESVLEMDKKAATRLALSLRQTLKTASPEEAWSKLVSEVSKIQYGKYAKDPQALREKAVEIWKVKFPGKPIPSEAAEAPNAVVASADQDARDEVRERAVSEGYDIIGGWEEGRGFRVRTAQGQEGYYY